MLYFNTCDGRSGGQYHAWGQRVSPYARHVRLAICTVGYAARYTHAYKTLHREAFSATLAARPPGFCCF